MRLIAALALALVLLLAPSPSGLRAEILIEAVRHGQDLRLVVDNARARVLVEEDGRRWLVDLAGGRVFDLEGGGGPTHARFRPGYHEPPPYRIEEFGPGPVRAGNASVYHVLFVEDRVCAEILVSGWMSPFLANAAKALAVLDGAEPGLDPCAQVPVTTLTALGWPLLVGKIDHPTLETKKVSFDYQPAPGELRLPGEAEEPAPEHSGG